MMSKKKGLMLELGLRENKEKKNFRLLSLLSFSSLTLVLAPVDRVDAVGQDGQVVLVRLLGLRVGEERVLADHAAVDDLDRADRVGVGKLVVGVGARAALLVGVGVVLLEGEGGKRVNI